MFDRILSLFDKSTPEANPLPQKDADLALGALLVRAARADDAYLLEEVEQIDTVLAYRHDLSPEQAAQMRKQCEALDDAMPNTMELAGILHGAIGLPERKALVAALWRVVFADRVEHASEDALLDTIQELLGVDPVDSMELRSIEAARVFPLRDGHHS